ncbi:MAG: phosphatidylserine decarboxylase family protein [Phycisphaerae bacterium]
MRIPLAKYGAAQILLFGGVSLVGAAVTAVVFWYVAPLFAAVFLFVLYFFRDPSRRVPEEAGVLVSPADGRVVEVAEVREDDFLHAETHKIAIFMSLLDVHVNRVPCDGRVEALVHMPGEYHNAATEAASRENEALALVLADVEGRTRILVRQVAGIVARRIVCDADEGDQLMRGRRYGMIKFGSRLEVFVPVEANFEPAVRMGQTVRGGETVLGRFR